MTRSETGRRRDDLCGRGDVPTLQHQPGTHRPLPLPPALHRALLLIPALHRALLLPLAPAHHLLPLTDPLPGADTAPQEGASRCGEE